MAKLPLMVADADIIYFKDGKRVDVPSTWIEDNQVKWKMSGIVIGYPKEDVERVEKNSIQKAIIVASVKKISN